MVSAAAEGLLDFDPTRVEVQLRPWYLRGPASLYFVFADVFAFALSLLFLPGWTWHQVIVLAVFLELLRMAGFYQSRLTLSVLDDFPSYVRTVAGVALVAAAGDGSLFRGQGVFGVAVHAVALLLLLTCGRVVSYAAVRGVRRAGLVRHAAVIVGAGHVGIELAHRLLERSELGVDPVGFVDDWPRVNRLSDLPAPLLGNYRHLNEVLEDFGVRIVLVAFGSMSEADLIDLLRTCDRLKCEIFLVPRLFEVHPTTRDLDQIRGMPLVRIRRSPFRSTSWHAKRLIDVAFAAVSLVVLSPVLVACALAVRLDGGPDVLFRQQRVGLDNQAFDILKFRSMRPASTDESNTTWNIARDARLTPVGRFLRKTSLDELPQLWNILRGDMSLVGPRPERPHFVHEFSERIPRYTSRHRVPAGLTGWAQVNGLRGDTSIEERARFDNYYVENWSLWMDIKIMIRTIAQVLQRHGG